MNHKSNTAWAGVHLTDQFRDVLLVCTGTVVLPVDLQQCTERSGRYLEISSSRVERESSARYACSLCTLQSALVVMGPRVAEERATTFCPGNCFPQSDRYVQHKNLRKKI